jgi:proteasome accessory factor B
VERSKTQFARLLELDRRIRSGGFPNCLTFSREWEVSQKTVQRDIDYLRDQLGAPVEYDRERRGYFYSDASWFLPSLSLSEGDLLALLVGVRAMEAYRGTPVAAELERVFGKLAGLLPDRVSIRPELVFSRFSFTGPPAKPIDEKVWTTMVRGVLHGRRVRMSYRAMGADKAKDRTVEPYHLANLAGEWYVFARCRRARKVLQFAVPRISKARLLDEGFEIPEDFDAGKLLSSTFGRFAVSDETHKVRLLFDKEIAPWVLERQWHPRQKVRKRKSGDVELSFETGGLFEVFRWVLAWGRHARVLGPEELKEQVRDEVHHMQRQSAAMESSLCP